MRKTAIPISILLLILTWACGKDEVNKESTDNSLLMYGMSYPLVSGVLWHEIPSSVVEFNTFTFYDEYTRNGKVQRDTIEVPSADVSDKISGKFIISLYGKDVEFNDTERRAYGKSNTVVLHLSVANDDFETGTYSFSKTNAPRTFFGYSSINYNFTDKAGAINPIGSGEITVNKDGDTYEVIFDCKSTSNQILKGVYKGPLRLVDNREVSLIEVKDVVLSGLSDTSYIFNPWENPPVFYKQAFDYYSQVYMISSTGMALAQGGTSKIADAKLIDLSYLNYYPTRERCAFISPVKIRPYMNHSYYHKNHTKIINDITASGINFTVEDFDRLTSADGTAFRTMSIESDDTDFPVDTELPRILLFQNSYGVKGAIKINEIVPIRMIDKFYENEAQGGWVYHKEPGEGYVRFDIKMQKTSVTENIK